MPHLLQLQSSATELSSGVMRTGHRECNRLGAGVIVCSFKMSMRALDKLRQDSKWAEMKSTGTMHKSQPICPVLLAGKVS